MLDEAEFYWINCWSFIFGSLIQAWNDLLSKVKVSSGQAILHNNGKLLMPESLHVNCLDRVNTEGPHRFCFFFICQDWSLALPTFSTVCHSSGITAITATLIPSSCCHQGIAILSFIAVFEFWEKWLLFVSSVKAKGHLESVSDELLLKANVMTKLYTGIVPCKFATEQCNVLHRHALLPCDSQDAPAHSQNALYNFSAVSALWILLLSCKANLDELGDSALSLYTAAGIN